MREGLGRCDSFHFFLEVSTPGERPREGGKRETTQEREGRRAYLLRGGTRIAAGLSKLGFLHKSTGLEMKCSQNKGGTKKSTM